MGMSIGPVSFAGSSPFITDNSAFLLNLAHLKG